MDFDRRDGHTEITLYLVVRAGSLRLVIKVLFIVLFCSMSSCFLHFMQLTLVIYWFGSRGGSVENLKFYSSKGSCTCKDASSCPKQAHELLQQKLFLI